MTSRLLFLLLCGTFSLQFHTLWGQKGFADAIRKGEIQTLSEDGSWCWFQDDRAVLLGDKVIFSGVTASGANTVTAWDLRKNQATASVLSEHTLPADDHNVSALMVRTDGKLLSVYAGHSIDSLIRYRISASKGDIRSWSEEKTIKTNGRVCYSNVYRLEDTGETFNFYRGNQNNPHFLVSTDEGETWDFGGRLFEDFGRAYLRYASDGKSKIHFITTEEHPRHYNNSIYHGYYEGGNLYRSDGTLVGPISRTANSPYKPTDFTMVYDGNAATREDVAWTSDIKLNAQGNPYIAFSVTKDPITRGETRNTALGGFDHRYHVASWDGTTWTEQEIAYAGSRLYPGENEYTGLITLHPRNQGLVYISTDVDPVTGKSLDATGQSRYEIFRGQLSEETKTWTWSPLTYQSSEDNIRPIVLADNEKEVVLWLNGRYTTYKDYRLSVKGKVFFYGKKATADERTAAANKKITFLISEDPNNYEATWTIPNFANGLAEEKGYRTAVQLGEGPREGYAFPKKDEIASADLLVVFMRRVALPHAQLQLIQQHLQKGKPLIGIRTANHAFSVPEEQVTDGHQAWWDFVPEILGHENRGYGPADAPTTVSLVKKNKKHPILRGIPTSSWTSQGNIYLINPLSADTSTKQLLRGSAATFDEPVAFVRQVGKSKIFYTSLGYPTDFTSPPFQLLLENAVEWALK